MPRRAQMYDSLAQLDMFPDIRGTRGEVTMRARGGRVTNSGRVVYDTPRGYAFQPGTGPKDQTCSTCAHFVRRGKHFKCALCRPNWTHSPRTDIRAKSPACTGWADNSPVSPT
jgi:hypothetical protein